MTTTDPGPAVRAWAPGRCTLVGEHVDYAGGLVACVALDLGVEVFLRPSADGRWRVRSGDRLVERRAPRMCGDIGDRVFAAAVAMAEQGLPAEPLEVGVAATLPESAGLASSAALIVAVAVALLRRHRSRWPARRLAAVALHAEHDLVGVPVGPLDHRAVILAPPGGVLLLDCATGGDAALPWPWPELSLVACHTGQSHDVGGAGYRSLRREVASALAKLGASSCRELEPADLERGGLSELERRRLRHVVEESARAEAVAPALRSGDAVELGRLMSASHASLRDQLGVSTDALDAAVGAAARQPGCLGARLVGAGFGGTAVALVDTARSTECARAMAGAVGSRARTWRLRPGAGMASLATDAVVPD